MEKKTILIVSSSGGHLFKTFQLKKWWSNYHRIWITRNDDFSSSLLKNEVVYSGYFPENRNVLNFMKNFFLAIYILIKNKPDYIFSCGAGIAPPFFFVAKMLKIQTIFMETFIFSPTPTMSGKILYRIADYFIVQNKGLLKVYPNANYWGSVI